MTDPTPSSPLAIFIFGGTGDLSFRKLLPALFMAFAHQRIRPDTRIIATGRQPMSAGAFREQVTARSRVGAQTSIDEALWQQFIAQIEFLELDAADTHGYRKLGQGSRTGRLLSLPGGDRSGVLTSRFRRPMP